MGIYLDVSTHFLKGAAVGFAALKAKPIDPLHLLRKKTRPSIPKDQAPYRGNPSPKPQLLISCGKQKCGALTVRKIPNLLLF